MPAKMTKGERTELAQLARKREKVAIADLAARSAGLIAQFDELLASEFAWDHDETWALAYRTAEAAADDLNTRVAELLTEQGVPLRFAPRAELVWRRRGENEVAGRRAELRRAAKTRIGAMEADARLEIERASLEVQTRLIASGLESVEAWGFLESMPTVEQLMQPVSLGEVEKHLQLTDGDDE
jgi:hypothetical protein